MSARGLLYQAVHPMLNRVARNRFLIRLLFQVDIPRNVTVHFDPTTLLLHIALRHVVVPADKSAIEIGIGQGALLALGLRRSTQLEVQGVDCSSARVASSRLVAHHNAIAADFFVSDLFSAVPADCCYDLIFFNPPYVPTRVGRELKLTRRMRADSDCVWDGGQDGTAVLGAFLSAAPSHLSARGRVLFGVQPIFVPDDRVLALAEQSGLALLTRVTRRFIPSVVYVLGHAPPRTTPGS